MNWLLFWLVLHVLGAILAFGPTYAFPIIGDLAKRAPQHISFALRVQERVSSRIVLPLSASLAVSGVGLLFAAGVNLARTPYLWVAIALYLAGLANGLFILLPTGAKLVHMADAMTGARALASAGPGAAAAAPPAEFMALIKREQVFGAINGAIVFAIVTDDRQAGRDRPRPAVRLTVRTRC
ncbi:MAG: DUF2269 family protein [Candidatus Dormibacteraeota bacterium]|nr:DUF2269 family protein [Candidatus Dormibacteraeota bacterium]MBV9526469.1 DUF2269 family protein [Candidatus Dormibacteraeota bacterium]